MCCVALLCLLRHKTTKNWLLLLLLLPARKSLLFTLKRLEAAPPPTMSSFIDLKRNITNRYRTKLAKGNETHILFVNKCFRSVRLWVEIKEVWGGDACVLSAASFLCNISKGEKLHRVRLGNQKERETPVSCPRELNPRPKRPPKKKLSNQLINS